MHPVDLYMRLHDVLYTIYEVTGHLSEGLCVWNVVVHIPKFDAKPNTNLNSDLTLTLALNLTLTLWLYVSEKMTLRTSELLPIYDVVLSFCRRR